MSLLVLAPIKADSPEDDTHVNALRELFGQPDWGKIQREFFGELSMLHMARFQIIEHLTPAMGDRSGPDELLFKHLLFVAEIDGPREAFYDQMYRQEPQPQVIGSPEHAHAGAFVRSIWGHCAAYPEPGDDAIYLFRRFMRRYQFASRLPYRPFDATRDEIMRALLLKEQTQDWMPEAARLATAPPEELKADATDLLERLARVDSLRTGELQSNYSDAFEDPDGPAEDLGSNYSMTEN